MADEIGLKITLDGKEVKNEVTNIAKTTEKSFEKTEKKVKEVDKSFKQLTQTVVEVKTDYRYLINEMKSGFSALEKSNKQIAAETSSRKQQINQLKLAAKTNQILKNSFKELTTELRKQTEALDQNSRSKKENNKEIKLFSFSTVAASASVAGFVLGVKNLTSGIVQLNDKYALLRSQIKLVIDEGNNLESLQDQLLETSNRTRQEIETTIKLYTRLDRATEQLGKTDKEVIALTETINKALLISGASASESSAALLQFSQGLASGVLRGEELNSVMENAPRLAKLLADGLGVTIGQLRALGAAGELTSAKVVTAIESQSESLNEEFSKVEETVSQGWIRLTNSAESYLSKIGSIREASKTLSQDLSGLSKALDDQAFLKQAKETALLDRSYKQQIAVVNELSERYDLLSSARSTMTKFQIEELEILKQVLDTQRSFLPVIKKREDAVKREAQEQAKLNKELKEAENLAFTARKNAFEQSKIEERRQINAINRNKTIKEYNDSLLELLRTERAATAERERAQQESVFEFENNLIKERKNLDADFYERRINRINEERDARILAAGEIAQTEEELIRLGEQIHENSEKKKAEISKAQMKAIVGTTLSGFSDINSALRDVFGDYKAFAIADIGLKAAQGIMQGLTLPPPQDFIKISAVSATSGIQFAKINGLNFANGTEFVGGSGTPTSDSVQANLSVTERVVPGVENVRLNGIRNDELADAVNSNDGLGMLGIVGSIFTQEEIAQRLVDLGAFADSRGLTPV